MISFDEARNIIWNTACHTKIGSENIPLSKLSRRVCFENVRSPLETPPFDNSAMDGFAVIREDLLNASPENPLTLQKVGMIAAGDSPCKKQLQSKQCLHIMTGAPVPAGANAVVPIEFIKIVNDKIFFENCPKTNDNIRFSGEDFKKNDLILTKGNVLYTQHILPLASLGISHVKVYRKPKVLFLSTGNEVVDNFDIPLAIGQIYNSNKPYAVQFLEDIGCECLHYPTIKDDPKEFLNALHFAHEKQCDVIISTGAVSAGEFDFVKKSLEVIGTDILYHKIKLRPGKPNLFAKLSSGILYFGLPGNPVSTAVGLRMFVFHAIKSMLGQQPEIPFKSKINHDFTKKYNLHGILKAKYQHTDEGYLLVNIMHGQDSFMVNPFLEMNCWVSLPETKLSVAIGETVDTFPL